MTTFNSKTHPLAFFTDITGINDFSDYVNSQEVIWALDMVMSTLKDSGIFNVVISDTQPTDVTAIWVDPNNPATDAASVVKMRNTDTGVWVNATPDLFVKSIINKLNTMNNLNADLLDGKHYSDIQNDIQVAINSLIDTAPGALDTLNELAASLGDDPNFATTVTNALALKVNNSEFTQSLVQSGYQKLPNGLIIQWGKVTVTGGSTNTVTLPISWVTGGFSIVGTPGGDVSNTGSNIQIELSGLSQFVCNSTYMSPELINYIAVGK